MTATKYAETNGHGSSGNTTLEPIAIVGLSCVLPGEAINAEKLWEMLEAGRSAWGPVPPERFSHDGFYDPSGAKIGTAMDPQQRLLLEIAYKAFENAGLTIESLWGSNTGVYVGQWTFDYHEILCRDPNYLALYQTIGTGPAISSNRLSHFYNLQGPSFTVDTGCSSSLVALHQAIQSLRNGESDRCFVAGVNLTLDPQRFTYQSRLKMFSNEGRSFPFDSRANGYGRGEGCTGVVLQPLRTALEQGFPIRAVIRNSVINQDGRTPGISVPNGLMQSAAIRKAYSDVGLPLQADYVEAHGTGTKVGDPIEAKAISDVLAQGRDKTNPLPIGSIKGNVGHLESNAGLTGLIKAVLMLEKGKIPPHINFEMPSENVPLEALNLRIPVKTELANLRRISVNCFGYGGTNAHVILDHARDHLPPDLPQLRGMSKTTTEETMHTKSRIFLLSANSEKSCQDGARNLGDYITEKSKFVDADTLMNGIAYTLSRRSNFSHRAAIVASEVDDLVAQLQELGNEPISRENSPSKPRLAFAFSGQGAQYPEMGRALLGVWPSFTKSIARAERCLKAIGCPWNLKEELTKPAEVSRVEQPEIAQPLSTAVQLALVNTLAELGVLPSVVVGHSSGEIAAAYCAQAISFDDAMIVSYHRGRLTGQLQQRVTDCAGAMLAVGATPEAVDDFIKDLEASDRMKIACFNSPSSVTVSGDRDAIVQLQKKLEEAKVFSRMLRTGGAAYHSHQMLLIEKEYLQALQKVKGSQTSTSVTMVSSLTGAEIGGGMIIDRDYWVRNLVSPVLFTHAMKRVCQTKSGSKRVDFILEVGPHSQLGGPIKQTLRTLRGDAAKIPYAGTLKRGSDAEIAILETVKALFLRGFLPKVQLANNGFNKRLPSLLIDMPEYSFDHSQTYWHESRVSKAYRQRKFPPHELLGTSVQDYHGTEPRWVRYLRLEDISWLRGHVVQGQIVFPAAAYIAMAIQAIKQHTLEKTPQAQLNDIKFRNISFGQGLVLAEGVPDLEITLALRPQAHSARKSSSIWNEFRIFTVSNDSKWTEHCRGLVTAELDSGSGDSGRDTIPKADQDLYDQVEITGRKVNPKKLYFLSKDLGLDWSSPFNNLVNIKTTPGASISTVNPACNDDNSPQSNDSPYVIHPAILDSCLFQSLYAVLIFEDNFSETVVPTFIKKLNLSVRQPDLSGKQLNCYATRTTSTLTYDINVFDWTDYPGRVILRASGVTATQLPKLDHLGPATRGLVHSFELVTEMGFATKEHIGQLCKGDLKGGSVKDLNLRGDAIALSYIQRALKAITLADIPEGYLRHWYSWMQTHASQTYDSQLLNASPATDNNIGIQCLNRLGPNLPDLLTGAVHPLTLMKEDDLLTKVYLEERCLRCYSQIAAYCRELGRQWPTMKVLEVGAGTASVTLPIMQALENPGRVMASQYDFTDISAGFFPAAKERLSEYENIINYKTLDIEEDPAAQGFTPNSYDLIIACNVIHATSQIDVVVKNVQALLRPGGKFLLMETTVDQVYYNLIFGAFSGWWAGYDEGRRLSPLLSVPQWQEMLEKNGFDKTEPVFSDYEKEEGGTLSVFVAHAKQSEALLGDIPSIDVVAGSVQDGSADVVAHKLRCLLGRQDVSSAELLSPHQGKNISVLLPDICELMAGQILAEQWDSISSRIKTSSAVLFITQDAGTENMPRGAVDGFCRSLRLERQDIRLVTLHLGSGSVTEKADLVANLLQSPAFDLQLASTDVDCEFIEQDDQLYVPRIFVEKGMDKALHDTLGDSQPEEALFSGHDRVLTAEMGIPGLLETLRWKDDPEAQGTLDPNHIKFRLHAASINFKDVLIASGRLEGITQMQNDCSGVVVEVGANMTDKYKPGDKVCALYSRSYTNYPIVHGDCCHLIPESMSFEAAASLPIVWTTVYYSIIDQGRLKKGESILIHSAAGAVGQAAIMLAKYIGADIFATVGSDVKKQFLVDNFGIPEDHIFSSRTVEFHQGIMNITNGGGVDVVLNSLGEEMFRESCNTIAPFGRFVEIGRKDLMDDALMPMEFLLKNITFAYVDLALVIEKAKPLAQRLLRDVVSLVPTGAVRPVMITALPISEMEAAFRLIQAGKHMGKIILTVSEDQKVKILPARPALAPLQADATYIIVGGLGGLGKQIISWMADRGAKNIVTISRSGQLDTTAQSLIAKLKETGVFVSVKRCDITSDIQVQQIVQDILSEMPPIRGVIQSAMVLQDSLFDKMTYEQWMGAIDPKVKGSWILHTQLPASLDFFIMLSSAVAVSGNVGQSNYAAGCSFQDSLARFRRSHGLPAHSINVGAAGEAGYVSENTDVAATLRKQGFGTMSVAELLGHLDHIIAEPPSEPRKSQTILGLLPSGNEVGLGESTWMNDTKFAHVRRQGSAGSQMLGAESGPSAAISLATSVEEATEVICKAIVGQLSKMIGIPVDHINAARSLDHYGVDSLVAVELRNWIGAYIKANVPLMVLRSADSIQALAELVTKESRLVDDAIKTTAPQE
ncbi:hypothetical protein THARTR1_10285 [Trichoderma harzianum]|uniref:Uncharacterized protein n=1 Tax=Trichoderma harzianum TaxID=5544 RepID=A0A2K0TTJ1_TRIHA|nr:hypothetical protein THARTR1_10285 [Trichoderma harzianum]